MSRLGHSIRNLLCFYIVFLPYILLGDLNNGLVAWYPFDGNASDMSGNGRHGTVHGATLGIDRNGRADRAYIFDGVNDRIVVDGPWISGNSPRSVSIWAKSEAWVGNFFTFGTGKSNNDRFSLLTRTNSTSITFVGEGNDFGFSVPAYHQAFKHFVLVYDGSIGTLFVNNASYGSFSKNLNTNGTVSLVVGSNSVLRNSEYFKGNLDELRVYSRALSTSEVSALYNLEKPKIPLTDSNFQTAVNLWFSDEANAIATYGHISDWNVSAVTDMANAFKDRSTFNEDISGWDVSNVKTMRYMFYKASLFNQPIGDWNVSSVTSMQDMFREASVFDQPIGNWDVSKVTTTQYMFNQAVAFNQPLGNWDVSSVTNMSYMFSHASVFNQDIGSWDISKVTNMSYMFHHASLFNQDIGDWNTSAVTSIRAIFHHAPFNYDLSDWNTSAVTNMIDAFVGIQNLIRI